MMSASPATPPESYSQEEVQQILHLAIAKKTDRGELTRAQLWEIAAELEIDSESIQTAERDWLEQQAIAQKRQEFNKYRLQQLKTKVVRYLIINSFLMVINLIGQGTLSWSLYVLLILGLPLSLATWKTLQTEGEEYEQAFQRWSLKNEVQQSLSTLWNRIKQAWQG